MADRYDVIIIGAGIGGGALATVLARGGKRVLLLEKTTVHRDRVRGEWMAPWGVAEAQRIGLYDDLIAAGGHHLARHITFDETLDPDEAAASVLDMTPLVPGVPGPLCLGHPAHCDLLNRTATDGGATLLRGANVVEMRFGDSPSVTYEHDGARYTAACRMIVGADGRGSHVRRAAGIELHRDPQHHLFSGLLIEGADGWPEDLQVIGAEKDVHYLVFPQGKGRARLYLGYPTEQAQRLTGEGSQQRFLEAFRLSSVPRVECIANATPAGPCNSYPNEDSWTDEPFAEGVVLVGDAAGWNDPIIGQGLSITYRDVRIVSEVLLGGDDWSPAAFASYAEERAERMRRLRIAASTTAEMLNEFGEEARARRKRAFERQAANPMLQLSQLAAIIGPDAIPEAAFEESTRAALLD